MTVMATTAMAMTVLPKAPAAQGLLPRAVPRRSVRPLAAHEDEASSRNEGSLIGPWNGGLVIAILAGCTTELGRLRSQDRPNVAYET